MKNKSALKFFAELAAGDPKPQDVKVTKNAASDFTHLDAEFILRFAGPDSRILDLGSGSGLIVNKIAGRVGKITAVEKFPGFSRFIAERPDVEVINSDILEYVPEGRFDFITLFGVVQYFSGEEAASLYKRMRNWLTDDGRLIVKNQFGVQEDVLVDGFSDELQTYYASHYRHIDSEQELLRSTGYASVQVHDIYPPECNRWSNTHFYAIVAERG